MSCKNRTSATALLVGAAMASALACQGAAAANITYSVNEIIGVGSVTGTVTTDGATGVLGTSDFLAWNINLNGDGASTTITSADVGAAVDVQGSSVFATPTDLFFNFSGTPGDYLLIQDNLFSGQTYWCNAVTAGACYQGMSVVPIVYFDPSTQIAAVSGEVVVATAATSVPEPSTLGLLLVGVAALACGGRGRVGARCAVA